jgi:hypothetical protein
MYQRPRRSRISDLVAHELAEAAVGAVVAVVSTVVALGAGLVVGGLYQRLHRSCTSGGGGGSSCSSRVNSSSTWWGGRDLVVEQHCRLMFVT